MATPIFAAHSATFVASIPLPHIYDRDRIAPHGWNGRPAVVRLRIPQKLEPLDTPPSSVATIQTTDVYLYRVSILMPGGYSMREVEIGVTTDPDAILAYEKAWRPKPNQPRPEAE